MLPSVLSNGYLFVYCESKEVFVFLIGLFVSQSGISFKKLGTPTVSALWRGSHSTHSLNWGLSSPPNLGEVHGCWVVAVVVAAAGG